MRPSPARLEATFRGVAVGAVSFGASLTAHALAMPGDHMSGHAMTGHDMSGHAMHSMPGMPTVATAPSVPITSVLLLAAVCAILGLLAARPRAAGPASTGAMLLLGQGVGHLALGVTMGHLAISPTMAAAHLCAAIVAGIVIAGAEHALRVALAVLTPRAATWRDQRRTVVAPVWTFRAVPLPVLARHGALRAPPR